MQVVQRVGCSGQRYASQIPLGGGREIHLPDPLSRKDLPPSCGQHSGQMTPLSLLLPSSQDAERCSLEVTCSQDSSHWWLSQSSVKLAISAKLSALRWAVLSPRHPLSWLRSVTPASDPFSLCLILHYLPSTHSYDSLKSTLHPKCHLSFCFWKMCSIAISERIFGPGARHQGQEIKIASPSLWWMLRKSPCRPGSVLKQSLVRDD